MLPNFIIFDTPPTKKRRLLLPDPDVKPTVHIAASAIPTSAKPGAGSAAIHIYEVPDSPIASPRLAATGVHNTCTKSEPLRTQPVSTQNVLSDCTKKFSPLLFLLDCVQGDRVPSVEDVFKLMDHDMPGHNLDYVEAQIELEDHGYKDALDIYTLGVEHLATFGALGMIGARFLYAYTEEKIIRPLGIMNTKRSEPSVQEVADPTDFKTEAMQGDVAEDDGCPTEEEIQEIVLNWVEGIHDCEEIKEDVIDEMESAGGTDVCDTGSMSDVARFRDLFEESFKV